LKICPAPATHVRRFGKALRRPPGDAGTELRELQAAIVKRARLGGATHGARNRGPAFRLRHATPCVAMGGYT